MQMHPEFIRHEADYRHTQLRKEAAVCHLIPSFRARLALALQSLAVRLEPRLSEPRDAYRHTPGEHHELLA